MSHAVCVRCLVTCFCSVLFTVCDLSSLPLRVPSNRRLRYQEFDPTCGFPGEGPHISNWSLATVNVGSLKTSNSWKACSSTVTCLQETRIGKNGINNAMKTVQQDGSHLFHGALLPGLLSSHGVTRTPHGGVAIIAAKELTQELLAGEDATGLYQKLRASKRVQACWVQITRHLRLLVFSVYCKTAASADRSILEFNNSLLRDVFAIASQWGDIPVIIAGDFQLPPLQYPVVAHATNYLHWCDALQFATGDETSRPITFSMDGNFTGFGDGCSSIDGLLTNSVASAALASVEVLPLFKVQHRPVKATFNWKVIWQQGFKLYKPAPFVFPPGFNAQTTPYSADLPPHADSETQWHFANQLCIDTLLDQGASWGAGPQDRGSPVRTRPKQICPGQTKSGAAATKRSSWLRNALGGLYEIQAFHSQNIQDGPRKFICHRTIVRTWSRLFWLQAPCLWPYERSPTLVEVSKAIQWVLDTQAVLELKIKLRRIQNWKNKINDSANIGSAYLFRHLRNKNSDEPANLIVDKENNIVFAPNDAIAEINNQWDSVYSVNEGFPHPMKMLEIVWPYVHQFSQSHTVPSLTAEDLQCTVKQRRPEAAPGLDGWRTVEMQKLPTECFQPFALLFRNIEEGDAQLPRALTTAKQIILNKNGSSEPLQKRLITLLPVILLAYTGARFRHLRDWQMNVRPMQLQGGIPTRQMSAIHTHFALTVDDARRNSDPIIGIKIDKAKCFDRIIPQYAGALMLTFGVPKGIVNVFLKMYVQLERHLQYKSWFAPVATHTPNGVAQGCSLSLIAVNVHMKAWVHMLEVLPTVSARAFIDDAYLWTRLIHSDDLYRALHITQTWDCLVGQAINEGKCSVWGTTAPARKCVKALFPHMKLVWELEVLGVHIRTSDRNAMHFSEAKCAKIVADIKNIGALPLSIPQKAKIIGCKVIPQCTYNAAINGIPSKMLSRIQGEIVNVLWNKRPHWRSRFLVFAFMSQPHRVEPLCARHYNAISDMYRFLAMFPHEKPRFRLLLRNASPDKFSIAQNVKQAFRFFSLELDATGMIKFRGQNIADFLDFTLREIKPVLKQLARQACYAQASLQTRKDFAAPGGFLDDHLSTFFVRKPTFETNTPTPATAFFQAQLVGCVLTNDRLAAAKFVDDASCRLCLATKESLPHLVRDCPVIKHENPPPVLHELGRNFELLGIVEHPWAILAKRLCVSNPSELQVAPWTDQTVHRTVWTDGSVMWQEHFAVTCAGFAVVDQHNHVIAEGPVHHWLLTSYTAELWALIHAFVTSTGPLTIKSDCKAVVDHVHWMCQQGTIDQHWPHVSWWHFLYHVWHARCRFVSDPLIAIWIPAHLLEQIPEHLIDEDMAHAHGSTVVDILRNRTADHAAKNATIKHAAIHANVYPTLCSAVLQRQEWLTKLCIMLGQDAKKDIVETDEERHEESRSPQEQFPALPWGSDPSLFQWRVDMDWPQAPVKWAFDHGDWSHFGSFIALLRWREAPDLKVSFTELAVLFLFLKLPCSCFQNEHCTFQELAKWIKSSFAFCRRQLPFPITPGHYQPHIAHTSGKSMPPGSLCGARPYFCDDALMLLTLVSRKVTGAAMSSWAFAVAEFR